MLRDICSGGEAEFGDAIIKQMGPDAGASHTEGKPVPQMQRV